MNNQALINQIEPLLSICVKMADRQDLDQISFSKTRAKEILSLISTMKFKKPSIPKIRKGVPAWLNNPD
jgi:hypothetical protein